MSAPSPDSAPRSSFVSKLHGLLCAETHPEYLHWLNNDTFAITSIDAHARLALAPQWDFRSLSSFVRQLSYYSFKRLSDRRRSAERRSSVPAFIVFTHPSGNFVRDDADKAALIARKLRARKPAARRKTSTASSTAMPAEHDDGDGSPSPTGGYELYEQEEDVKPNVTHLGLSGYQLPPWNPLVAQGRTIRSEARPIPGALQAHVQLPRRGDLGEGTSRSPYETFPSPMSAPSASLYRPPGTAAQLAFRPDHHPAPFEAIQQVHYYPVAPAPQNPSPIYAFNRLPPLQLVTGALRPPSPPPEQYSCRAHGAPHGLAPHDEPHEEEERTPSPLLAAVELPLGMPPSARQQVVQQLWPHPHRAEGSWPAHGTAMHAYEQVRAPAYATGQPMLAHNPLPRPVASGLTRPVAHPYDVEYAAAQAQTQRAPGFFGDARGAMYAVPRLP